MPGIAHLVIEQFKPSFFIHLYSSGKQGYGFDVQLTVSGIPGLLDNYIHKLSSESATACNRHNVEFHNFSTSPWESFRRIIAATTYRFPFIINNPIFRLLFLKRLIQTIGGWIIINAVFLRPRVFVNHRADKSCNVGIIRLYHASDDKIFFWGNTGVFIDHIFLNLNTNVSKKENPTTVNAQPKAKRRSMPVFWQLLRKAKNTFDKQLDKTNQIKFRCVERVVGVDASDVEKFWLTYKDQVDSLLDSKRFERQCEEKGLTAKIVAEHIVFLGNGAVRRVRDEGVDCLGSEIMLYQESFTSNKLESVIPSITKDSSSTQEEDSSAA